MSDDPEIEPVSGEAITLEEGQTMIRMLSRLRSTAHERSAERHFQRAWDRAVARAGSDSHLDEINAIFARSAR